MRREGFSARSQRAALASAYHPRKEGNVQRVPIIANIYGYAVCLIAVVVFFIGTAAFIGGAFNLVHPMPMHAFQSHRMRFAPGGHPAMNRPWRMGEAKGMPGAYPMSGTTGSPPQSAMQPAAAWHNAFIANARYAALRRTVIALAMLMIAGILFMRHWRWLHSESTA